MVTNSQKRANLIKVWPLKKALSKIGCRNLSQINFRDCYPYPYLDFWLLFFFLNIPQMTLCFQAFPTMIEMKQYENLTSKSDIKKKLVCTLIGWVDIEINGPDRRKQWVRQDGRDAMRRTRVASRYAWVTLSLPVFFFVMPSGSNWGPREILAKMIVLKSYQKRRTINFYGCSKNPRSLAWVTLSLPVFFLVMPF